MTIDPSRRAPSALADLRADIAFTLRSLRRRPGFALVTLGTLGLGIGMTALIASIAWNVVYEPLPYREPDRVVDVWPEMWWSKQMFTELRDEAESYQSLVAWSASGRRWAAPDGTSIVNGPEVSSGLLEVLGAAPLSGRDLRLEEELPGSDVVMLTDAGVQRFFGADPEAALGSTLRLDERPVTVVGVLPRGLPVFQTDAEVVSPTPISADATDWTAHYLHVAGRLREGVEIEGAAAEMRALADRWREESGRSDEWDDTATVVPLRDSLVGDVRPTVLLLVGAVALILLVATANVASLLLARALERDREVRVRAAMGAVPWRLARQLFTESTITALAGSALGVALAYGGLRLVVPLLPADTPRLDQIAIDPTVVLLTTTVALAVGWLTGLAPVLHALGSDLKPGSAASSAGRGAVRLRSALVVGEVALTVVLLVGAGLLAKSFLRTLSVDLGFRTEGLLTLAVVPEKSQVEGADGPDAEKLDGYFESLQRAVEAVPGVEAAALAHALPVQNPGWVMSIHAEGRPPAENDDGDFARWRPVTPGYFETVSATLLMGRGFDRSDRLGSSRVGIVNESTAEQLFPDGDAVGGRVVLPWEGREPIEIVGVIADVRILGARQEAPLALYRPYAQAAATLASRSVYFRSLVVRTSGAPRALEESVIEAIHAYDRGAAIDRVITMSEVVQNSRAEPRVAALLVGLFGLAGVILGAVGIYGVMECFVRERLREISIRAALGASRRGIVTRVLTRGIGLVAIGVLLGYAASRLFMRGLESQLFQVSTADPTVAGAVVVGVLVVAVVSTWRPALRAGGTDPVATLRGE